MGCGWREEGRIGPKQKDADFWIKCWELLTDCAEKNWDLDVKHVKAHRTEKEKKATTKVHKIVMEEHDKADCLAKGGDDVDGGNWQWPKP